MKICDFKKPMLMFECSFEGKNKLGKEYFCNFHYNCTLKMYRRFYLDRDDFWSWENIWGSSELTESQKKYITCEPELIA